MLQQYSYIYMIYNIHDKAGAEKISSKYEGNIFIELKYLISHVCLRVIKYNIIMHYIELI